MCFYCKGDMKNSTTAFTVQYGKHVIVIKNVPCEECTQCGETVITDDVMQIIEKLIEQAKQMVNEVTVIDYKEAA